MTIQPTAFETYLQQLPLILDKMQALRQLAASGHFDHKTNVIRWEHVDYLEQVDQTLDDLLMIIDSDTE